jgi:membrane protein
MLENELVTRASAAAYYALTAFVPFLALVLTLAAHLLPDVQSAGNSAAIGGLSVDEFREALSRYLPEEAYDVVAGEIARLQKQPPFGVVSLGLVISLWLASSLSGALIDALNRIHGVDETRSYLALTLAAIGMTVLQAVIVLGTLVALVVWPQASVWLGGGREAGYAEASARWLLAGLAVFLSFVVMSHLGPNVCRSWKCLTPGSVFVTLAVLSSGLALRWYVHIFGSYGKTYGSLGGVMLLSFWFWITALVVLIAVQMNKVIEDEKEETSI